MNISHPRRWAARIAALGALGALLSTFSFAALPLAANAAPASKATAADTAAAQRERAERAAFLEKQKALAEEKGVAADAPAASSTVIMAMPQDEADAPGAVRK